MADQIDDAQEFEQLRRDIAVKHRMPRGPVAKGSCLFCDASLPAGKRWCDQECRDLWQKEEDLYARKPPVIGE